MIKNPYIKNNTIQPNASINKLRLLSLIPPGDEEIYGKSAFEIFSSKIIAEEIRKNYKQFKLEEPIPENNKLPIILNKNLDSPDIFIKRAAETIADKFGTRLGYILLTLKRGNTEDRKVRNDWSDEHWEYWKLVKNIALTGGLVSDSLGRYFKSSIERVFKNNNEEQYNIVLNDNSSHLGSLGVAMFIKESDKNNLVFDFGQSYIKRSMVTFKENILSEVINFEKIASPFMMWEDGVKYEKEAVLLDGFLRETIVKTFRDTEVKFGTLGGEIAISIANYIDSGRLLDRGGYGKLNNITDNYEKYLGKVLSSELKRDIVVRMMHDGMSAAASFYELENAACITVGTAFGVGFPVSEYNKIIDRNIEYKN